MAMSLMPRFVVLRNGRGYLNVPENLPLSLPSGFVKFNETNIWNPRVKFAVEVAQTGNGQLVHIRSCYNNKYLVANQRREIDWIVASSDKPEEDQSKATCTLFEPYRMGTQTTVRLRHVHSGISAEHWPTAITGAVGDLPDTDVINGLLISRRFNHSGVVFTSFDAINWETLVILPSLVTFRSEHLDGNYLSAFLTNNPLQMFRSGHDVGDPLVAKELFPTPDGNYRIRDVHFGRFWRRSAQNWIWADAAENNHNNDTMFSVVRISNNVIALRNLGNNQFCGGLTASGNTDCLSANYPTMSRQTRLIVEERVLERHISDVRYRLSDSRIYQEVIQEVSHSFATNDSLDHDARITLTYSTSDSRTSRWTNSVSVSFGVSVTFTTTIIPFIARSEVQVTTELGFSHEWGQEETTENTRESSHLVVVPPLTTIKVSLMCSKAACDVPFSYTKRDLLTSGETVTTFRDDGIYTGINAFNFYFQSSIATKDNQGRIYVDNEVIEGIVSP